MSQPASKTVGDLIDEMALRYPANEAVVFSPHRYTYLELKSAVDDLARGLLARGIGKGDHVAILMGNRPEWLLAWFAINKIGAVAVGVSTWSSTAELAYILRHSDSKMLITCRELRGQKFVEMIHEICPEASTHTSGSMFVSALPFLRSIVLADKKPEPGLATLDDVVESGSRVSDELLREAQKEVRPNDVALLVYTSGSTGTPKGVQLAHRGMIENGFDIGEAEDFGPEDRFWLALPLFWSAGNANTTIVAMTHGGALVLQEFFEPETALRLMSVERCTHYFAFPNVTKALFDHPARDRWPLSNVRVALSTGNPEGLRMLLGLGFTQLLHPYGTTEDYGFATITTPDDALELIESCQGQPLPGIEISIVDPESGRDVGPNENGEICIGGHVTPGYYKDEDKNEEAFDALHRFHTGDLGFLDDEGRLHLLGRIRELMKIGGFNVAPAEVESALLSHPEIAEAYVVGLPDGLKGERAVALVRAKGADVTEADLREFVAERLSSYKVPAAIRFRESFPLTDTGKVSKKLIIEQELASATLEGEGESRVS